MIQRKDNQNFIIFVCLVQIIVVMKKLIYILCVAVFFIHVMTS